MANGVTPNLEYKYFVVVKKRINLICTTSKHEFMLTPNTQNEKEKEKIERGLCLPQIYYVN